MRTMIYYTLADIVIRMESKDDLIQIVSDSEFSGFISESSDSVAVDIKIGFAETEINGNELFRAKLPEQAQPLWSVKRNGAEHFLQIMNPITNAFFIFILY